MRIVSTKLQQRHSGLIRALSKVSDSFFGWNPGAYPAFDLMEEIKPDVVFIDLRYVTKGVMKAFNEYPDVKVVLFGQGVPAEMNPSAVIARPDTSPVLKKNIESKDYKTLYQHDSANVVDVFSSEKNDNLSCEVGYVFDNHDPEVYVHQIVLLAKVSGIFNTKIVGDKKITLPNYLGGLFPQDLAAFYRSCDVVLDYNAEHILDIAANRGFAITTVANDLFPSVSLESDNVTEKIESFLGKEKTRKKIAKKAQREILSKDTCYHRLAEIFRSIDELDFEEHINQVIEDEVLCVLE